MWGFDGFKLHSIRPPGSQRPESATREARRILEAPQPSKEEQWQKFVRDDLSYDPDELPGWIKLATILKGLNETS